MNHGCSGDVACSALIMSAASPASLSLSTLWL